ncbi:trypsin delta-like [Schistocerca americana]|uniref:trypsin delta-like n=1 Tax=Schistocerca americana TaxID=7009 RepID=UPI001F4FDE71|nr:trypsin delta-like [Schistocerca americana]
MLQSALVVCLLLAVCSCERFSRVGGLFPDVDERIVDGETVNITQYPWTVSLQFLTNHRCGGSIISPKWVLTAANVVYGTAYFYFTVRAGTSTRESGGYVYDAVSMILHEDFNTFTIDKDIGVFEIAGSFTYDDTVQPIALADYEPEVDVTAYITGWGVLTSSVALDYADELQAHSAVIMERNACNATYECEIYGEGCVTENMICTTEKPWCTGDGGGPLVINNIQYGIASWGYTCGPGYPGVYANVAALRAWVNQTTGV